MQLTEQHYKQWLEDRQIEDSQRDDKLNEVFQTMSNEWDYYCELSPSEVAEEFDITYDDAEDTIYEVVKQRLHTY